MIFDDAYLERLTKRYGKGTFVRAVVLTESTEPLVKKYWVDSQQEIVFQGNTYEPIHMRWSNIKASGALNLEGSEISVSNLARKAEDYVETIDIKGAPVVVQLLHLGLLGNLNEFYQRKFFVIAVRADVQTITLTVGHELGWTEEEFDDEWGEIEQAYYNELVEGHDGDEVRDLCDLIVSERKEGIQWLNTICGEGRARFVPSGMKWRYVVDRPRTPGMLVSEPGNLIEGSVVSEPLQPDSTLNHMFVEFRDSDKRHLPNVVVLPDPDFVEGSPINGDGIKLDTVTRESQADREAMYYRKKQALVRRHWEARGNLQFLYPDPQALVYLYYPTASHKRGVSGFVKGGSVDDVVLDRVVDLESGETYQIVVQHAEVSEGALIVETRTIDSSAGKRGRVHVSTPFANAPVDGDVYSLDKAQASQRVVCFEGSEYSDDDSIRIVFSDYVAEVHNQDPLPPKSVRRFFDLVRSAPLPLRAASVIEEIAQNRDGSHRSTLIFDVTPSFNNIAGQLQGLNILAATEPALADFYNGWQIEITEGPGIGEKKKIVTYSDTRVFTVDGLWTEDPTGASLYKLSRERYGELTGFRVESSTDGENWVTLDTYSGVRGEYRERVEGGLTYFRFTPISNGVENKLARWVRSITTTGDLSAPAAPVAVTMAGHLKQVSTDIFQQRPTAEDLAGFEVEFWLVDAPTWHSNPENFIRRVSVPVSQDNALNGTMLRRHTENFSELPYGSRVTAIVRAYDRSNNYSPQVFAVNSYLLEQIDTGDVAEGALTEFAEFVNDSAIGSSGVDYTIPVEIASVTLATVGRPVRLDVLAELENTDDAVAGGIILELRRGPTYAGSLEIVSRGKTIKPEDHRDFQMMRVHWPAPGTYTFKVWMYGFGSSVVWSATNRYLAALEIKDQAQAA